MTDVTSNNDYAISIKALEELNEQLHIFQENYGRFSDSLFFDIKDVIEITGWSKKTVEDLFNHPMFPCTDLGKRKLVLKTAFIKFFSDRRCKDDESRWKYVS